MPVSSIILLASIFFALSFEWAGRKWGIAAIPTLPRQRRIMIGAMKKYIPDSSSPCKEKHALTFTEMGCGWGGLIAGICKEYPSAHIVGYEAYTPAALCARARFLARKNITIRMQDFFTADLSHTDVVVCYLSHGLMRKLQQKFEKDLKPGSLIVSNAFPLPDWTPIDHIVTSGIVPLHVWIYRKD